MNYKNYISKKLNIDGVTPEEIESYIVLPPDTSMGDFALPCFKFAKILRKAPNPTRLSTTQNVVNAKH